MHSISNVLWDKKVVAEYIETSSVESVFQPVGSLLNFISNWQARKSSPVDSDVLGIPYQILDSFACNVKVWSHDFRFVSFLFGPVKDLLEDDSDITSRLGFENYVGLVAKSVFTGFSESAFMSFHLLMCRLSNTCLFA